MNILITDAKSAEEHIHSLSRFGKKAGLSNIKTMLERLGNPHIGQKFVHVAGTNGKGSVSNMIKNILVSHGYKVGYYTSPYIEFFNERICIGQTPISDNDLVYYTNKVKDVCYGLNPIEFEFITAMAFLYFKDKNCDITVLEVGLGGRFDATNIIETPLLNVITPIGYDHTAILGDTLEKIAFEKSGTIKENSTVVISPSMARECVRVIENRCAETNSELVFPKNKPCDITYKRESTEFVYDNEKYNLSLLGTYQVENAVLAIESAKALMKKIRICQDDIKSGLSSSRWKCRFEILGKNPPVIFDGAHNSHGIKALTESIRTYFPHENKVVLFSMLGEKDWEKSIDMLSDIADTFVVTKVPSIRQSVPNELFSRIGKNNGNAVLVEDPGEALQKATHLAGENGVVFVTGSLYLCGYLRKYVEN